MPSPHIISLITLEKKHFSLFYAWWNDPELRKLTSETDEKILQDEIDEILKRHLSNDNGFDFIITVDKIPVGHILIQKKRGKKNFEFYIAIGDKKYWSKGIGTVAINKACHWFFKKFPREKMIQLQVLTTNVRAIKCYEHVGFKKIRTIHSKKHSDTIVMRKTRA